MILNSCNWWYGRIFRHSSKIGFRLTMNYLNAVGMTRVCLSSGLIHLSLQPAQPLCGEDEKYKNPQAEGNGAENKGCHQFVVVIISENSTSWRNN
mmetsp:Transcript_29251/g.28113  ORF Transcript_29251/g.28113 Transcript_29251/m.28113 type:complete len:95 (+) Transcript_29251:106-390(+)